jgi:hypothetical protein
MKKLNGMEVVKVRRNWMSREMREESIEWKGR